MQTADNSQIDKAMHSKAAKELGLTEGSAPQIYNRLLKKLREGDCYFDEGEEGGQDTTTITAPNTATKKAAPKKRKGDGDPSGSPAPKKAGRGKKDVEKGTPEATKEDAIKNEEVF